MNGFLRDYIEGNISRNYFFFFTVYINSKTFDKKVSELTKFLISFSVQKYFG